MERKVFIIDDDAIMGNLLQSQLAESGFEAEYFNNGNDALAKLFQAGPAEQNNIVVIADMVMAPLGGKELCDRMRQNPKTANIPFIFLISREDASEQSAILKTKADAYIFKPFKMEDLLDSITKVTEYAEKVRHFRSRTNFKGKLSQLDLSDIVQIAELNRKNGELVLKRPGGETIGKIFFSNGCLAAAEAGELEGEDAFFSLLSKCEKEGTYEFFGREIDMPGQIASDNTAFLIKANLLFAQSRCLSARIPHNKVLLKIISREIPPEVEEKAGPENLRKILSMIQDRKTAAEIISNAEMSHVRARAILATLFDADIIDIENSELETGNSELETGNLKLETENQLWSLLADAERRSLTGVLAAEFPQTKGAVFVRDGRIVHAYYGSITGKKAVFRLFSESEKEGRFSFRSQAVIVHESVHESLSVLREEGVREAEALQRLSPGSFESTVSLNQEGLEGFPGFSDRPGLVYILSLVQQFGRVRDVIDASRMTDLQTYKHLLYMVQKGLLTVEPGKSPGIRLITDSAADLPPEFVRRENITVIPLSFEIGGQMFRDGADLSLRHKAFYQAMKRSGWMKLKLKPKISPPCEDEFHDLIRDIVPTEDIFAIFISGKICRLSDRAASAGKRVSDHCLSQNQRSNPWLEFADSGLVSLGTGLLVAEAADKIRAGASPEEVQQYVVSLIPRVRLFFVADSPAFLLKNGQIGKGRAFMGNLLGSKPILMMQDGEIAPVDRARGEKNARELVLRLILESLGSDSEFPVRVGVVHADAPEQAALLRRLLESRLDCRDFMLSEMGPAVGCLCGPGSVGVACLPLDNA